MSKKQEKLRVVKKYTDSFGDPYSIVSILRDEDGHRVYINSTVDDNQTSVSVTPEQALAIRKQLTRFLRATGHLPDKGE